MSAQYRISKEDILQATDGGLRIFEFYFPEVDFQDLAKRRRKFKAREEATASAAVKCMTDGNYVIADFGDDGKWYNGITYTQKRENLDYGDAIKLLAGRFNVGDAEQIDSMFQPKFSKKNAKPDQADKTWEFEPAEFISESHLRILFSKHVWSYLEGLADVRSIKDEDERKEAVISKLREICTKQHWHSLDSYTIIKERKATTIEAAEYYPIFCIEETYEKNGVELSFKKIYQPKAKEKGNRFFYYGDFDPQFLHGLSQAQQAFQELQKEAEKEDDEEDNGPKKLPEIIYCTGGSDALNMFALGYHVTYGASEYFKLNQRRLRDHFSIAEKLMTCPDLDATGQKQNHELCMNPDDDRYLNIHVIELPEKLKQFRDQYRRPCKDVRDFLNYFRARDFNNIVKTAKPYRFWDYQLKVDAKSEKPVIKFGKEVYEYRISNERILNFVQRCGFCINEEIEGSKEYIHIDGYIVRPVDPSGIKNFLVDFLRSRYFPEELINLIHRSPALNDSSFAALENKQIEFKDYEKDCQYFFFLNEVWKISAEGIEALSSLKVDRKVWENKIIKHSPRRVEPMFKVFKDESGEFDIEIDDQSDMFFRFLIQTSRIHWRKELEENLSTLSEEARVNYLIDNKFNIEGPLLTATERKEQKLHLINKMYVLGYMLHRYKDPSNPWALFAMDGIVSNDGLSHGGTGKSIFSKSISYFRNTVTFDGKDENLFKNNHAFDRINTRTDYLLFDDAGKSFQFSRLFSIITGNLIVNKKTKDSFEIEEERTPKIGVSTNFTPSDIDQSTLRRLIFSEFADYYHIMKEGDYNETRQPVHEFGKNLFKEYDEKEWNSTINFMMQCCSMYFNFEKIEPPTGNILVRNLIAAMHQNFYNWADVYFSEEADRLDKFIPTDVAIEDYKREGGVKNLTSQSFNFKMKCFAQLKNLAFNPAELLDKDNRILKTRIVFKYDNRDHKWVKPGIKKTQTFFYLRSAGEEITADFYDPTEDHIDHGNEDFPPLPPSAHQFEDF